MERVLTVEERIRRAEEIYARRKQDDTKQVATVNVNDNKKDLKLLWKMIKQIIICVCIYLSINVIRYKEEPFFKDCVNRIKDVLSYDTNYIQIYDNCKNWMEKSIGINGVLENKKEKEKDKDEKNEKNNEEENKTDKEENKQGKTLEGIGGAEITEEQKLENQNMENKDKKEEVKELTEEEKEVKEIKDTASFIRPLEGGVITSKFGWRDTASPGIPKNHTGTDIAMNLGTKIKSATDGEVVLVSEEGDYGKHIKIQIGEVSIIYAHCNNIYVKHGDKIKQGQEIGEVGSTGNSTGPHLHFEIRLREKPIDPQKILEI